MITSVLLGLYLGIASAWYITLFLLIPGYNLLYYICTAFLWPLLLVYLVLTWGNKNEK